ncbi:MAG: dTMP kinase [Acidobacteriota bacterium]
MERKGRSSPMFVSFEGIDGCGKSTLMESLSRWLDEEGIPYISTREPGGTVLGESIRSLLLDPSHKNMSQRTEVLLYTASRAQIVDEVIRPALDRGVWVLSDRYTDATLAYQGYGRGLDLDPLRRMQLWATGGLQPHRTILLDCDVQIGKDRLLGRSEEPDRIEQESRLFHERVRNGYLELAQMEPERFVVIDASLPPSEVVNDFRERFWKPVLEALHRRRGPGEAE